MPDAYWLVLAPAPDVKNAACCELVFPELLCLWVNMSPLQPLLLTFLSGLLGDL